ncbi:acetoacetyl-CoA reductase [Hypericibacter adhaerens]|uniref:Acetoacetyl-CoA reductase n=1 Tax=Hypericibacter adhaerens TaxID=2602016 RepID=A0A5J6MSG3_9PROT|nr:SDR family NAD(P)-dependent oxidoreductase [Hypericibacter adhaerens]QEX20211.1 acetoacetyl-CoA reductase [Hypericibacter adhaerens]
MADNQVAIVTGAAGGMGQAIVARLVADGFKVAAVDINESALRTVVTEVGDGTVGFTCDMTDEKAVRETVARIERTLGPTHALVNCIGWVGTTRFIQEDSAYWRKIIAINMESILYATHAVLPGMIERLKGKIVNISSDAGRIGTSGEAVYAAMKAGVIAFGKSIARENARYNINVNAIAPGPTETPLLKAEMEEDPELVKRMLRLIPFRRPGKPDDMAAAVSFFCSPDSDYITGQTLSVSGGLTML